jgi:hypothetical protein
MRGEPSQGIGDAFVASGPDPGAVASIGVESWANVPAVDTVWGPGPAAVRLFKDKDVDAGRGDGRAIEVVGAVDLGPSGELGIESGASEEIETQKSLW